MDWIEEETWEGFVEKETLATNAVLASLQCWLTCSELKPGLIADSWKNLNWHTISIYNDNEMKEKQCVLQIRDLVQHGTWQQEAGCCLERKGGKGEFLFRLFLVGSWMCSFKPSSIPWTMYLQVSSRMGVWLFWNSLNIRVPSSFSSLWMGAGTSAGWLRCSTGSTTTAVQGSGPKTSGKVTIGSKITWYLCETKFMRHWKTLGKLH